MMQKRSRPVAIRFHKANFNNNPHKYFLSELMLYIPFRDEEVDFKPYDTDALEKIYLENEERIKSIKGKVMEYLESVEEARYYVEEALEKLNLEEVGATLDAAKEQEQSECEELMAELHPEYAHIHTDNVDKDEPPAERETHIYSKIDIPDINELKAKTRRLDQYQREVLNVAIKYAKDLVKSRRETNPRPRGPLYMVHGGAGSGKTFLIKLIAEWVHHTLQQPGDSMDQPYVLKTAFTGTAASLIEGMTLHSAFGFDFGNKHYSLSDKVRDRKKNQFKNLEMILLDEVSMVKSDMMFQLDLRLQEIKEKIGVPFGGVAIFTFGDMLQLRPVLGRYVFEPPKNNSYLATYKLQSRWKMFKIINLEKNHRQGKFKDFADMLNRIRVGQHTEEDIKKLEERIRPRGHQDLQSASLFIVCTKKECGKINMNYLENFEGDEIMIKARHFLATRKKFNPYICRKEGTIGNTQFMDKLSLKNGCKVILIHNIDTSDGLTNGQLGVLKCLIKNDNGQVVKLIIEFENKNAGAKNRKNNSHLLSRFPNGTVIEKAAVSYQLTKKSTKNSGSPTLIQFPIKLAQAITAHKIQGQSIPRPVKVALDLASVFENSQAYVMLSRVEDIEQLYILDEIVREKIAPNFKALSELKLMNMRCENEHPQPWKKQNEDQVKIAHLNVMNLLHNYEDILCDTTLMESDIILCSETWLTGDDFETFGPYAAHLNNVGPGKGVAVLFKKGTFQHIVDIKEDRMQLTKMRSKRLDIIAMYRSSNASLTMVLDHLESVLTQDRTTIICGDFNLCYIETRSNKITKWLEENGFRQLVREATHIRGRLIDHFYIRENETDNVEPSVYRYSPYYSDHDAICTTIKF